MKKPKFWNWLDDADSGERTLMLNGTISDEAWFGDEVTPKDFKAELAKCSGDISVLDQFPRRRRPRGGANLQYADGISGQRLCQD